MSRLFSGNGSSTDTDLTGPHPFEGWSLSWFLSYESSGSENQSGYDGQNSSGGGGPSAGDPQWEAYDTFSKENIFNYAESLNYYWVDPSYDVNSITFPPYDPAVDGPIDAQGYRKNGPPYQYVGGSVQNYTNDSNGGKYAIFTDANGVQTTFPGATITDFGVMTGAGVTTANGGIHMSTVNNGLSDLQHEYGHYLQAQQLGTVYYIRIVPASLYNAATDPSNHRYFWTERDANKRSADYFGPNSAIALDNNYPK